MNKNRIQFKLSVTFLREKKLFVAYSPALDLSTSGKTYEEARRRFTEAAMLFFEELAAKGTAAKVLRDLGWQKNKNAWQPPLVISCEPEVFNIPAAV